MLFVPTGTGMRTALLEVVGDCNSQAQLPLEGDAAAPCVWERQPTVDLGKVPLSQPRTLTVTCVLKNTGPLNLAGDMRVVSSPPEIVVKNTGKFVLTPGQCFDVQLDVTAATAGVKTAVINFGLPAECGDAASTIKVEIVEPRVIIDTIDFGRIRLLTPTNGEITISNLNTEEAEVTSIAAVDASNPHFSFTIPATPQKLAPGASVKIPVVFTPQARGPLTASVRAIIKGKESSPLIGEARGVGFLPAIAATGYTFTPWTVNTQSPDVNGKVVIRNTDADNALTISNVAFVTNDPSFTWTNALPTFPVVLAPGSAPLELPITGPNLARELVQRQPAGAVGASTNPEVGELIVTIFKTNYFRVYTSDDIVGCELAAALKNVVALAVGIVVAWVFSLAPLSILYFPTCACLS